MATLHIPTPLRPYTEGQSKIELDGKDIAAVLSLLVDEFPAVRPYIYDEQDHVRPYVNMFLNGEDVRNLQGDETPVGVDDKVRIVPSIAGGVLDEIILKMEGSLILGLDSQIP
jgi:molybdopterin converting factor small subunit